MDWANFQGYWFSSVETVCVSSLLFYSKCVWNSEALDQLVLKGELLTIVCMHVNLRRPIAHGHTGVQMMINLLSGDWLHLIFVPKNTFCCQQEMQHDVHTQTLLCGETKPLKYVFYRLIICIWKNKSLDFTTLLLYRWAVLNLNNTMERCVKRMHSFPGQECSISFICFIPHAVMFTFLWLNEADCSIFSVVLLYLTLNLAD